MGFGRLDTGTLSYNPVQDMNVSLHLSVLCCLVEVEALRWADPPPRDSYDMWN
jgi:hypothetical protein